MIKSTDMNYAELELDLIRETEKAYLFSNGDVSAWVAKSLLEDEPECIGDKLVSVIMPEWVAKDKNFI